MVSTQIIELGINGKRVVWSKERKDIVQVARYRGRADRKNRNAAPRAGRELDEVLVDNDDSAVTVFNRGYLGDDEAHSGA